MGYCRSGSGRSGPQAVIPIDEALASAREHDKDEDELERLIDEVREARERLSHLIATIKSERAGWGGREQRWDPLVVTSTDPSALAKKKYGSA
jgi:hypothetical protein